MAISRREADYTEVMETGRALEPRISRGFYSFSKNTVP